MLEDHAKIVSLLEQAGEVVGRKKLQKIIYILKKCDVPFQEKYHFHFFGPYSEELSLRIEELCNLGFINEVKETKGGYYQYRYTQTEAAKEFLSHFDIHMETIEPLIQELNNQNSKFLELVSTILYFDDLTREEIIEKVQVVKKKQNYSLDDIEEAFTFIASIKSMNTKVS
ncbi:YwgA family protein [Terrilactibacillus laevilacticus]|uniref:YwgA family protein n=1 Tax=Terrilactibacillus laevilacticus TaxID=1380157 RepID=A0ABW5PN22_9BACI|nr:YwgA family protein [Terrilactibacillus laevilacticus]